jgi:EAL domain-containing protein (putative c-di-GMP-specific phosphodiesterase class I)|tara:strand:+ start:1964 stop:3169 length:1206 start_codon:yes stop_codon:yes gene_type:complete
MALGEPTDTSREAINAALSAIRQHLGMPIAYVSEFVGDESVFRYVDAPGLEHLIKPGDSRDLSEVYCLHILEGRLPELIPDTAANPLAQAMPITRQIPIGAHMSIPIHLEDGTPFGMFCCLGPNANPSLNERDLETMRLFSNLAAQQIDKEYAHKRHLQEMRERIMDTLETNAFAIAYQPIVDLGQMHPSGYEALCRFSAEPYRTPDVWFDEAAKVGLSVELELASIRQAVEKIGEIAPDQYISVNVSPSTVISGQFAETFLKLPLDRILLEITEHAVIEDYDRFTRVLRPLRHAGLRLAVDDAGAGHSSLRHIVQLNPDYVKVDMSLTRNVDQDLARRALIGALLFYTRETSAHIIAEGIETEAELNTLKLLGVRRGQGYLLGRPSQQIAHSLNEFSQAS